MNMKLFAQSLNSGVRFPSPVFEKPDDQGGGDAAEAADEAPPPAKPSAFANAKGLAQFREEAGDKPAADDAAGDPPPAVKVGEDGRPENVPAQFWDADKKTIRTDSLVKSYNDLRAHMRDSGKSEPAPESPDGYFDDEFKLDEDIDRIGLETDDPGLKAASKVFHKYGISKTAAVGIVKDMFKEMNQHAPVPIDPAQELKALGANGKTIVNANMVWLEGLERDNKLGDADAEIAMDLMKTANGARFLNKMRGLSGQMPIPVSHGVPSTAMSPEEWHSEYQEAVKNKDEKRQAELDAISAGVYGNAPASGSPIRGNTSY